MRSCPTCHRPVADGDNFCAVDGTALNPTGAPVPSQAAPLQRITCEWCHSTNETSALSCRTCGAPLTLKNLVSESGWREAPRLLGWLNSTWRSRQLWLTLSGPGRVAMHSAYDRAGGEGEMIRSMSNATEKEW